ncbi:hypothetical protein N7456_003193 [Penicillium angulare]|uniref:O-methyltransferase n=1 Tax=Penicillium angulare TaxID=116970 RepID=A0A9W9FUA9_9EURO|nr:hypothetical protein N7456_003193 [Penicillium angulare]
MFNTRAKTYQADNPKWTAVDDFAFSQSHPASRANAQILKDILSTSTAKGLPSYALSPAQGKFIALHCRVAGVTHVLEVGTLGGYSAIWMASENPKLQVTTIEYNLEHVKVAKENIKNAGLEDRIEVLEGSGVDVLTQVREQVFAGARPLFGFVFIDADKVNNWRYFQLAREMVKPNSVICVDNVVRDGQVVDFADLDPSVKGSRQVIRRAGKEPGVDSVVLQTVGEKGYDGWLWAVVS